MTWKNRYCKTLRAGDKVIFVNAGSDEGEDYVNGDIATLKHYNFKSDIYGEIWALEEFESNAGSTEFERI